MKIMSTLEIQRRNAEEYRQYFESLGKMNPEQARREATRELIKMGLLDINGNRKETIVSWE